MSASKPKAPTVAAQNRALVEAAFPGLTCSRVILNVRKLEKIHHGYGLLPNNAHYTLKFTVTGSAEDLIRHGFITQEEIDLLPPSGRKHGFERLFDGRFRYSASYWDEAFDGKPNPCARDMAARIGLVAPAASNVVRFPKGSSLSVRANDLRPELLTLFARLSAETKQTVIRFLEDLANGRAA